MKNALLEQVAVRFFAFVFFIAFFVFMQRYETSKALSNKGFAKNLQGICKDLAEVMRKELF